MSLPYLPRQFVWCRFPFSENPKQPGPDNHIGYILDFAQRQDKINLTIVTLYTTSKILEPGAPVPVGLIPISADMAQKMNQVPFVLNAKRVAFIPGDKRFFPYMDEPDHGIVYRASITFDDRVRQEIAKVMKRPEFLEYLGPDAPALAPKPTIPPIRRGHSR